MSDIIEQYKNIIIQIATPYSTGTGFYLKDQNLIITNEHVVRDNREVVIYGNRIEKQMAKVLFTDPKHDLAFLQAPDSIIDAPLVELGVGKVMSQGDKIIAIGHPFGMKYSTTQGIVSNTTQEKNGLKYIHHDAALNPGNSGGPLIDEEGAIVGVNTFIIRSGNSVGFSLPVEYLAKTIEEFKSGGAENGTRCLSCSNIVFENDKKDKYCPHCGANIEIPSEIEEYEPVSVAKTIEDMLAEMGHRVQLARRGPFYWEIEQGSAKISISYYEKTGLIIGDAYLCNLPQKDIKPLYEFLLRQNYENEGLAFSVKGQEIVLSLLIYDRYLNKETGIKLFNHLFERADYYDDILVDEYGANWKQVDF